MAAELFGGERIWTYDFEFNATDERILALEYFELGECIASGAQPEMTGAEGRADVALVYAPFESGRLGRALLLSEVLDSSATPYQDEIDVMLGLVPEAVAR
jgi:hypothetical protein